MMVYLLNKIKCLFNVHSFIKDGEILRCKNCGAIEGNSFWELLNKEIQDDSR